MKLQLTMFSLQPSKNELERLLLQEAKMIKEKSTATKIA
jgi:hypothetical protein